MRLLFKMTLKKKFYAIKNITNLLKKIKIICTQKIKIKF